MSTPALPGRLRQRFGNWFETRLPRTDHWVLTQHRIYVLPSPAGWFLALTALLLLIASINYQINLGFLFTFMLAGVGFISVLVAHGNLRGLQLQLRAPEAVFAGQPVPLHILLQHAGRRNRYAIVLRSHGPAAPVLVDVPAGQAATATLALAAMARGRHLLPPITIETRYPIGAFRVWSIWRPASAVLVWPAPEPDAPPLPQSLAAGQAGAASARTQSFEMDGFRAYQRGDPIKTILWKKTATAMTTGSGDWVRRDPSQMHETQLWLDHAATGLSHPEAVLARLCAWVLEADQQGIAYGLKLPHTHIAPATGPAHRHQCLEALALA
ncbi:DUF58 domain-containing protein [Corticibacter populi]|uniref:DUF58 domain-containing protein n=1 Tax=Corticibacter populi TaxID=1550736 RepID=A0A3M6QNN6_9BURK|nr:DUF58 domain-containing protein [Corticibacter populi]RMX04129.1 DUF58 domain-containing protein [Corticibacter populi]RZS33140.1 uncharacterized protein (DUF58 family) [Corticibacter populi]